MGGLCLQGPPGVRGLSYPEVDKDRDWDIDRLLVLPFRIGVRPHQIGIELRCPICGVIFEGGPVDGRPDQYLTKELVAWFKNNTSYKLVPPEMAEGSRSLILQERPGVSEHNLQVELGRSLEADAVVSGTIYRFRQRLGKAYSVEEPASVAFGIHLIRVSDGHLVWFKHVDETQQSLSQDLFRLPDFFRTGGGWLTAEELSRFWLHKRMASLPLH